MIAVIAVIAVTERCTTAYAGPAVPAGPFTALAPVTGVLLPMLGALAPVIVLTVLTGLLSPRAGTPARTGIETRTPPETPGARDRRRSPPSAR
ncbi:hypothetical protein [Streptomyces sp. CAU 1734]|uniref:hypothetical protein n=1 Tax=Streptomyces sp. CAU 1734 TaxID=3140360 RepID=UPI003260B809